MKTQIKKKLKSSKKYFAAAQYNTVYLISILKYKSVALTSIL